MSHSPSDIGIIEIPQAVGSEDVGVSSKKQFTANFHITGSFTAIIEADSKEAAVRIANEMMDRDEFGVDLDEVDCVDLNYITEQSKKARTVSSKPPVS